MKNLVGERLPEISLEISKFLMGSLDFVGLNHYTTLYARNDRTHIRKLILQDASSDNAVITTGMQSKKSSTYFLASPKNVVELIVILNIFLWFLSL